MEDIFYLLAYSMNSLDNQKDSANIFDQPITESSLPEELRERRPTINKENKEQRV